MLLRELTEEYLNDPMSGFAKKRWVTQVNYRSLIRRNVEEFGNVELKDIKMRMLVDAHARWSADGKITMGHGIVSMFRILVGFGAGVLEDEHCQRIKGALGSVRFENGKPRKSVLTFDQVEAILEHATRDGHYSIALAQAIQFGCAFRQKDVIGEYVPVSVDPRPSNIIMGNFKWVGGITREEVNDDLLLTHQTSKKGTVLSFPLRAIPIIMEEWKHAPKSGPMIIDPRTGLPFRPWNYTRIWRELADKAGVPRNVVQMDTRAGRITALLAMGIPIEDVKKFVGHRQSQTTAGYSRDSDGAIVRVADAAREAA